MKQDVGFLWQIPKEYRSEVPIMSYLFSPFEAVAGLCKDTVTGAHRILRTLTAHNHGHTENF
jgi:hypothetical protein